MANDFNHPNAGKSLPLPKQVLTRDGQSYNPESDRWTFSDQSKTYVFNFEILSSRCDPGLVSAVKNVLRNYLSEGAIPSARNILMSFNNFVQVVVPPDSAVLSSISSTDILNYKGSLQENQEQDFNILRGFFKVWNNLGYPGIEPEVSRLLKQIRQKGNGAYSCVLSMDPNKGPFTEVERQAIHSKLNDGYATGLINTRKYILSLLFLVLGPRPIQISALKIGDLKGIKTKDGTINGYKLFVPRVKNSKSIRTEFKERSLVKDIGDLLSALTDQVKRNRAERLDDDIDPEELPIFPSLYTRKWEPGFKYHSTGNNLSDEIRETFDVLNIPSERTGLQMTITPIRCRHDVATKLAEEGYGEQVIAETLDHSTTQWTGVYVKATDKIIERIDNAVAMQLAPLAQAFTGQIITNHHEAERGDDPSARIRRGPKRNPDDEGVGICGKFGFCGGFVPIACYTCRNFQPWLDGPHEEILEELLRKREENLKITEDPKIVSGNDRTIYAVAQVVRQCNEIRKGMESN